MAGPQKLQCRGRTGSSHSGTIYENSCSAVLLNRQLGEFLKTKVGVHQGCLLSPILFNLFLLQIKQATNHDHHVSISIGERPMQSITCLDDINLMGGNNGELQDLTNRLLDRATASGRVTYHILLAYTETMCYC